MNMGFSRDPCSFLSTEVDESFQRPPGNNSRVLNSRTSQRNEPFSSDKHQTCTYNVGRVFGVFHDFAPVPKGSLMFLRASSMGIPVEQVQRSHCTYLTKIITLMCETMHTSIICAFR